MKKVFVDTHYWLAITNPRDPWSSKADDARASLGNVLLVTTDEVLIEFMNSLSKGGNKLRQLAVNIVREIISDESIIIMQQSRDSFLCGLKEYESRLDKQYSMTDCISMSMMKEEKIEEALTNDHHFEQEGFRILIK